MESETKLKSETKQAVELRVHGRVQGVCFRDYTRRRAIELGLAGWVRNEADGSVAIYAEGSPESIERFADWCHEGSPLSRVTRVERRASEVRGGEVGFRVKH